MFFATYNYLQQVFQEVSREVNNKVRKNERTVL